ncbi:10666_t:CDS:2 [Entrophospora sp. SA101]|nr:13083_t:CDS:2 [Entrophospora sp. SA101]CAJ0647987.1 6999_t:CDS:2 [Entrophospora sp. SA101]CAJ0647991.1 7001_t:CDS:2 [Entrophospora sp. SA101]CAJ0749992.1 24537_t:CDS:2 [Entrophospora sp. SA101]CAJ0768719.1 10666_t:CDS:2 [Entrophospora sp. SA101]
MSSIAILGCGNVGFFLAAHLIHNNHHAIGNPLNNNKILLVGGQRLFDDLNNSKKLLLTLNNQFGENEDDEIIVPRNQIDYTTNLKDLINFQPDYILVTLKSNKLKEVFRELKELNGSKTVIVTIQNGIHNADTIQQLLPNIKIISGVNYYNIQYNQDCHFTRKGSYNDGLIILEEKPETKQIMEIFKQSELTVKTTTQIKNVQYGKLLLSLSNSIIALSGLTHEEYMNSKSFRKIQAYCQWETIELFNHYGISPITFNYSLPPKSVPYLLVAPDWLVQPIKNNNNFIIRTEEFNMSQDFTLGKMTEINELQGEIIKMSKMKIIEGGIDKVPYNHGIYKLVKEVEKKINSSDCKRWTHGFSAEEILKYINNGELPEILKIN